MGFSRFSLILALVVGLHFLTSNPTLSANQKIHPVRGGETLWSISRMYDVPIKKIARANQISNPSRLQIGQRLLIPVPAPIIKITQAPKKTSKRILKYDSATLGTLLQLNTRKNKWRYIVVHHSATPNGGARAFDHFHRNKRHMKNGLAYHFVVGNGNGAQDGQVEVGGRWKKQLSGGHCSNQRMNEVGIGICLVGNFEEQQPTRRQLESLASLVKHLQKEFGIPKSRVILHKEVRQKSTLCPGKYFPASKFKQML